MKFIIFNAICIILINVLLFLAIKKILNSQSSNNANNDFSKSKGKKETAEDHPIIRSARKRLGK